MSGRRLHISWWGVLILLLCIALFGWAEYARDEFPGHANLLFFLQTLAGNWSPPKPDGLWNSWFVGSAALAVALNLGAIGVLIQNLLSLARLERRQLMNTSRLFYLRDAVIKDELYKIFEAKFNLTDAQLNEVRKDVEQAYEHGDTAWANNTLPNLLGERQAQDFLHTVAEEMQQRPMAGL